MNQKTAPKPITEPELRVLESQFPAALTSDMRCIARCLFTAQVADDARLGSNPALDGGWMDRLQDAACLSLVQLQVLANDMGGFGVYIAKGVMIHISERYNEIFDKFTGHNHDQLAREYGLTPMRIYQILKQVQLARFKKLQGVLPGFDD